MGNACLAVAETFWNISRDITSEWWIKPFDVPMALLFRAGCNWWLVFQLDILLLYYSHHSVLVHSHTLSSLDSLKTLGSCFLICGGWFELFFIYSNESLVFYRILNAPLFKLNVILRKWTIFRLVLISMRKPTSLNIWIVFFLTRSICYPLTFCKTNKPSPL